MKQVGITEDKKLVMGDVGKLYFQDGLPFVMIFDKLKENNMIPSWLHLYGDLKKNGFKHERIINLLSTDILDSYGKDVRDTVIKRLNQIKQ